MINVQTSEQTFCSPGSYRAKVFSQSVLSLALVSALSHSVSAQESPASRVFDLGTISIKATAGEQLSAGERRVSSETIRELNLHEVGKAAATLPGVSPTFVGTRGESLIYVRGFDSRQIPIFLDGIPQYVPYDGNIDMDRFTTFDLSEIRVAKGAASLLYGPNTLGGAVNLVSRRPVKEFEGDVRLGLASGAERFAAINLGTNQGSWYLQAGLSWLEANSWKTPKGFYDHKKNPTDLGRYRENAHRKDRKVSFKFGYTPNATDEYAIGYSKQWGQKEQPVYVGSGTQRNLVNRYWRWPYWNKESVYFISNTALGSDHDLRFRVYRDTYENGLDMYTDATYTKHDPTSEYFDRTVGFVTELVSRIIPNHELHLAFHYKYDRHADPEKNETLKDQTISFAAEDMIRLGDDFSLRLGLSHERRRSKEQPIGVAQSKQHATNALVELTYHLNSTTDLYGSFAYKSLFPTLKDRYSWRMGQALPAPDLKAERARHFELGMRTEPWNGANLEAAVFYVQLRDAIETVTFASNSCPRHSDNGKNGLNYCNQNVNIGKARRMGVELSFAQEINDQWGAGLAYSYLHHKNQTQPEEKLWDRPNHRLYSWIAYKPHEKLQLMATLEAEKGRRQNNETRVPGFGIVGVKASFEPLRNLNLDVGVKNLTNKNYYYREGFPMPGRTYYANASYRF
ncbi:Colicin I receptor [Oligella sp. MSHR50489EDL]|uniref:TonB-dependent receptor plug domain-containing protein n=1 Tax=Oligella sp. MSHR50489EDL TaxID=3139409 RepID=UPI003D818383